MQVLGVARRGVKYKFIFMDCNMPVMDEYTAAKTLNEKFGREELPFVPIVAVTTYSSKQCEDKCFLSGMADVLYKPITLKKIAKIIRQ